MILEKLEKAMDDVIISLSKDEVNEHDVLRMVNRTVHYNYVFKPFIWELFFMRALKLNKVPTIKSLILSLFGSNDKEDFLKIEPDTRKMVLTYLKLEKSLELYNDWIARQHYDDENVSKNRKGMELIRETIMKEMDDK